MILLAAAFAQSIEPARVHVVGELSPSRRRKITKTLEKVEFAPAVHLVQYAPRNPASWSSFKTALGDTQDVATFLPPLEKLWAQHPQTLNAEHTKNQMSLMVSIVTARQQLNLEVDPEMALRVGHLLRAEPGLLAEPPEGLKDWAEAQQAIAAKSRHHRVHLGSGTVLWEGLPLELDAEGAASLPRGLWDMAGVEAGAITWTSRVQVASPVDVERALGDLLQQQILTPLEGDPCAVELSPVSKRWFKDEQATYVARGKRMWRIQGGELRRTDRRCTR